MTWNVLDLGKLHLYLSPQGSHAAGAGFLGHGRAFSTSLFHSFIGPAKCKPLQPPAASLSPASQAVLQMPTQMQVRKAGSPPTSGVTRPVSGAGRPQHPAPRCTPGELQGKLCSRCSAAIDLHEHLLKALCHRDALRFPVSSQPLACLLASGRCTLSPRDCTMWHEGWAAGHRTMTMLTRQGQGQAAHHTRSCQATSWSRCLALPCAVTQSKQASMLTRKERVHMEVGSCERQPTCPGETAGIRSGRCP